MNETKRKTEITIETHQLTIIRTRYNGKSSFVYCRNCGMNVASFQQAHAALIFRVGVGELNRLFQINSIHAADDFALCGNSLADFFNREIHYVED
ncbi:MAG TPA: hypothetical protein VK308_15245 [Pyrinomonadaceae bacterium]|nr:hypothetical protein [Pyrinomonadaceae bacterium]